MTSPSNTSSPDTTPPDDLEGFPPSCLLAYRVLAEHEQLTRQALEDATLLDSRTARHALSRLVEETDLVERRANPRDATRPVYVTVDSG